MKCAICGKENLSGKKLRIFCGEKKDGKSLLCDCAVSICLECMPKCKDCGMSVKTEVVSEHLEFFGGICELNPNGKCSSFFCGCENKEDNLKAELDFFKKALYDKEKELAKWQNACSDLVIKLSFYELYKQKDVMNQISEVLKKIIK